MSYPVEASAPPPAFEENKPLQQQQPPFVNQQPIIQSQPIQQNNAVAGGNTRDFQYGLFDCFSNPALCCIVFFVPCVTYGEISQETGYGQCISHGLCFWCCSGGYAAAPFFVCLQRGHLKKTLGIHEGSACDDLCISCFCWPCALCQMAKETTKYSMGEAEEQTITRV